MTPTIGDDRMAHLLMQSAAGEAYDAARMRLERACLVLSADASISTAWGQAALLTAATCGVRMFPGGVFLTDTFAAPTIVGQFAAWPLRRHLEHIGCKTTPPPTTVTPLHVGTDPNPGYRGLRCWADGWSGVVSSAAPTSEPAVGNEIAGVVAGALAVGDAFRAQVLGDLRVGRRVSRLSAFAPGLPDDASAHGLGYLPRGWWLLGLGNLGQAALWTIGLLPYDDPGAVTLVLQDLDVSEPGNLPIQILTQPKWIGRKKARSAAAWAEDRGFATSIVEGRFVAGSRRADDEPNLALVGVDNLPARRAAAAANFDLVLDGGLGATAAEIFDIRCHAFPGSRQPDRCWPEGEGAPPPPLAPPLEALVKDGRLDACGAMTIAGRSLGVPSTAVVTAAIQVAQACRAVADGSYCDVVDVGLQDLRRVHATTARLTRMGVLPGVLPRPR